MSRLRSLAAFNVVLAGALVACTGDPGPAGDPGGQGDPGKDALVRTSDEPAGANCPAGGTKIEVGVDDNGDGNLQTAEITSTSYVCDGGSGGSGQNSLVETSEEPAGSNCAFGGTKIETGLDADNDNVLDPGEVNAAATSYVCNVAPSGTVDPSVGLNVTVQSVTAGAGGTPVTVRFRLRDDRGFPVDLNGAYSKNTAMQPRFSLSYYTADANGLVSPLTVYTKSGTSQNPTALSPRGTSPNHGTLTENGYGAGDFTYVFPTATANNVAAVAIDQTKLAATHVVWIQASRQTDEVFPTNANTFYTDNEQYRWVPSGGSAPLSRSIASQGACDNCHQRFAVETTTSEAFHGGGRIEVDYCNVCHNPARSGNPVVNSAAFVHRIHNAHNLPEAKWFDGLEATYPQVVQNCATCHGDPDGAGPLTAPPQGQQAASNPSVAACTGCHAYVDFSTAGLPSCGTNDVDANGLRVDCRHISSVTPTANCASCHTSTDIADSHKPVVPPDPNAWNPVNNTAGNKNAAGSWIGAAGYAPDGAARITYVLSSVAAVNDPNNAIGTDKRVQLVFKLQRNGTDVVFNNPASSTELMDGFVGSPSLFVAYAVPQDGITAPTDFNVTANAYLRTLWNGTNPALGTLTGPNPANGMYTATLLNVRVPANATMLTGGVGYSYNLDTAKPLVQTNVAGYPYDAATRLGGIAVPAPNVWKVASGYTARRAIVDNAKCNDCHGALGVGPTFHSGERNDGPTCSFCHNPNRINSGWSVGSKYMIHAIHAGRKRVAPFTYYAASLTSSFDNIGFPGALNFCNGCHVPNTYDFTNPTNLAQLANELFTGVATSTYNTDPLQNSNYFRISPYIQGGVNYGSNFAFSQTTGLATEAADTTLVLSPITGACSSCHDSGIAINHMKANGGVFYGPRGQAKTDRAAGNGEQCLICHGPGRSAAVGEVHQR